MRKPVVVIACKVLQDVLEELLGSDDYVSRLVEATAALSNEEDAPDWLDTEFVVIPPGGEIRQEMFMR